MTDFTRKQWRFEPTNMLTDLQPAGLIMCWTMADGFAACLSTRPK